MPATESGTTRLKWSIAARVISMILGLGVLVWPMFSFGAIFMFDAPIRSRTDEIERYTFVLLTWFYPILYGTAWFLYRYARARAVSEYVRLLVWMLPAIAPAYYFWSFNRPE